MSAKTADEFSSATACVRYAEQSDAQFLAWAILSATRGHTPRGWFDIALGRSESDCLAFLSVLTTTPIESPWHYTKFLVMEAIGEPLATVCAFRAADAYSLSIAAITEAMGQSKIPASEQARVWERGTYLYSCTRRPDDDCWVIENVAAALESRRRGYIRSLLACALEHGRSRGLKEAQVTFAIGNTAAERTYESAGFVFAEDTCDPHFEAITGSGGLRRMIRAL